MTLLTSRKTITFSQDKNPGEREITPCIKIDKPLVVYRFSELL